MPPEVILQRIAGFRLITNHLVRSADFYRAIGFVVGKPVPIPAADMDILGLSGGGVRLAMSFGTSCVDLECFDRPGRPYPDGATACDMVFQHLALVTSEAEAAWLCASRAGGTPISRTRPVTLPQSSGGVTAIKFRDPDGHPLEFLQFPLTTSSARQGTDTFGIDHSAISVSDAEASERFYTLHRLSKTTTTINSGPAQDALDDLKGVEAEVVAMEPIEKPSHLEMLAYRHPVGRPNYNSAPNDVAATRVIWQSNVDALIRDPDGHFHELSLKDRSRADTASRQ
jgi:catechol 2,3-dioxygenase-like lactoylglutathione lyase family enzyme